MNILSNLKNIILIVLIIVNIDIKCKAYSIIKWNETAQDQTLQPPISNNRNLFPFPIAISNDYIIFGSYNEDIGNIKKAGAAYIYERASNGTWNLIQKLEGTQYNGRFGQSVGISNEYIIIGAEWEGRYYTGNAYIYKRGSNGTWNLNQILQGTSTNDWFGYAVDIFNKYAIISAIFERIGDMGNAGAVYIYERAFNETWNLVQKINGSESNSELGVDVKISDRYAIIGAPWEYGMFGTAYIYKRTSNGIWKLDATLWDEDESIRAFGRAVGISNKYVIISAWRTVYIYEQISISNKTWNLIEKFYGDQQDSNFGQSCEISNEYAIVGDPLEENNIGAIYIYRRDINGIWLFSQKLRIPGAMTGDENGIFVTISNNYILTRGRSSNKIYFYNGTIVNDTIATYN